MYPVSYEADVVERRNRLSTFFRFLLILPHTIVLYVYGIGAFFGAVAAWFALLFTGRYPERLYDVLAGVTRYSTRYYAYYWLAADPFPPFDLGVHDEYPARLRIAPPKPEYRRLRVLFRIFLAIPVWIIAYALQIVAQLAAIGAWFHILFTGRQHPGLQSAINLGVAYQSKALAYTLLLTEDWPPFSEPGELEAGPDRGILEVPAERPAAVATGTPDAHEPSAPGPLSERPDTGDTTPPHGDKLRGGQRREGEDPR